MRGERVPGIFLPTSGEIVTIIRIGETGHAEFVPVVKFWNSAER
jgi:hypothetical protein